MADEKPSEDKDADEKKSSDEKKGRERQRRAGIAALATLLALSALATLITGWAESWDHVFVGRQNPETADAYAWGTERPLQARVAGYVTAVLVDDNQPVHGGQVIAEIEDDNYRASVAQARAGVDAQQARLTALEDEQQAARVAVTEAEERENATSAEKTFDDQEAARQHRVLHSELGLLRAVQQADATARAISATAGAEHASTEESQAAVRILSARIALQRATVEAALARLELAQIDLGYTKVRAPGDGVVGVRQVHVGDLLSTGRTVIPMTPLRDVWVQAWFKETQIEHVRIGQAVAVRFDAFLDHELIGRVDQIGPLTLQQQALVQPDNTTGNFTKVVQRVPVRISLPADDPLIGRIRPGMSALVRVRTDGAVDVRPAR